jgi:hypothetical protein
MRNSICLRETRDVMFSAQTVVGGGGGGGEECIDNQQVGDRLAQVALARTQGALVVLRSECVSEQPPPPPHANTHLLECSLFITSSCHCWARTEVCEGTGAGAIEINDVNHYCLSADDVLTKL